MKCWKCGELIDISAGQRVSSRDECRRCGADLHSCRNCRFYDPSKQQQCAEPQAEWVRDKEAANYCDYFQPATLSSAASPSGREDIKKKFNALFRQ
jgi:hypothetical protein